MMKKSRKNPAVHSGSTPPEYQFQNPAYKRPGSIVQAKFLLKESLGIKFRAENKDDKSSKLHVDGVAIESLVADSQASKVEGLAPGMLLIGVQTQCVKGYKFKAALELMKTAGRPLQLTFVDISKIGSSPAALDECVASWQSSLRAERVAKASPKPPMITSSSHIEPEAQSHSRFSDNLDRSSPPSRRPATRTKPRSPKTVEEIFSRVSYGRESSPVRRPRSQSTGCLNTVLDEAFKRTDLEKQVAELQKLNLKLLKANFVLQNSLGDGHDDCMTNVLDSQTDKYVEYLRTLPGVLTEKSKTLQSEVRTSMNQIRLMLDAKEEMLMNDIREVEKSKIERIQEEISAAITGVRSASNRFRIPRKSETLSPNSRYVRRVKIEWCETLGFGMELSDPGIQVRTLKCYDDGTPGPASAANVKLGSKIKELNGIRVDSLSKMTALLQQLRMNRGGVVEFCFDEQMCFEDESVESKSPPIDLNFKLTLDLSLFQEQLSVVNFEEAVSRERVNLSLLRKEKEAAKVIDCMTRFSENVEVQRVGCCLLCNMALQRDNRQLIAESNGVQLLVILLEHNDCGVVCAALRTLSNMCADDAYREAVTNGVGLARIINLLDVDDNLVLAELAHTVSKLCSCAPETRAPVMHGVPALITLIHDEFGMSIQTTGPGSKIALNMTGGRRGSLAPEESVAALQNICQKMREHGLLAKLLAILFSPDSHNKRSYAAKCIAVIARDEESAKIIANAGAVRPLVEMISATSEENPAAMEIQISAAAAISALAGSDERRIEVCDAGGIIGLTRLLHSTNGEVNLHAAWAVKNVCINKHNKTVFARMNGIAPLTKLLSSTHHRVLKYTLWALAIVGMNLLNSQEICKAGAIAPILAHLKASDEHIQQYAAGTLMTLANCPANQQVIVAQSGISRLVEALSSKVASTQYDFQLCTMCTLIQVGKSKFSEKNAVAKSDGIPVIVRLIESKRDYISTYAMQSIESLLKSYPENKGAVVKAGAVPRLLRCAASHSLEIGNLAVRALSLLCDNDEAKREVKEAAGVPCMVKLLQTEGFDSTSQVCASQVLVHVCTLDENLNAFVECGGFEVLSLLLTSPQLDTSLRENIVSVMTHALYYEKVILNSLKPEVKHIVNLAMHQAAESFSSSDIRSKSSTVVKNWKKTQKLVTDTQTEMLKRYGKNGSIAAMYDTEDPLPHDPLGGALDSQLVGTAL